MNEQAIRQFADFLERVPEDRFKMEYIINRYGGEAADFSTLLDKDCHTAGCVAGFCAAYFYEEFEAFIVKIVDEAKYPKELVGSSFYADHAMFFTETFLGLTMNQGEELMTEGWEMSPKDKAEWLRGLVNE